MEIKITVNIPQLDNFFSLLTQQNKSIMDKIEELTQLVQKVQTDLDAKQDAIQAGVDQLKALVNNGGATSDQLQGIIDSLTATDNDLNTTDPDFTVGDGGGTANG